MKLTSRGVRVILAAESHLGQIEPGIAPERNRWLREGLAAVVDQAISNNADLLLHAGNLFATPEPNTIERAAVGDMLVKLGRAGITVCFISGDRDASEEPPQLAYRHLDNVRYLAHGEVARFTLRGQRVLVRSLGHSYRLPPGLDPLSDVPRDDPADIRILLSHATLKEPTLVMTKAYIRPESLEAQKERCAEAQQCQTILVAGGDHTPAELDYGALRVFVPGATERFDWVSRESDSGCTLVEIGSDRKMTSRRISTPSQPRCEIKVDAFELQGKDPQAVLLERIGWGSTPETLMRLILSGPISRQAYTNLVSRRITQEGQTRNFSFVLDITNLYVQNDNEIGRAARRGMRLSQPTEIRACVDELLENTTDPEERALLEEARQILLAAY